MFVITRISHLINSPSSLDIFPGELLYNIRNYACIRTQAALLPSPVHSFAIRKSIMMMENHCVEFLLMMLGMNIYLYAHQSKKPQTRWNSMRAYVEKSFHLARYSLSPFSDIISYIYIDVYIVKSMKKKEIR